jgi:hypothetical protein
MSGTAGKFAINMMAEAMLYPPTGNGLDRKEPKLV